MVVAIHNWYMDSSVNVLVPATESLKSRFQYKKAVSRDVTLCTVWYVIYQRRTQTLEYIASNDWMVNNELDEMLPSSLYPVTIPTELSRLFIIDNGNELGANEERFFIFTSAIFFSNSITLEIN
jgi:hypothetical protein